MKLSQTIQSGDWKGEKHVPVILVPETMKKGEAFQVEVVVGEEIPHPNTLEHYIAWIKLYFVPTDGKFPIELGTFTFAAHGESECFASPRASLEICLASEGKLYAESYCNIHGLWESEWEISLTE